jgi:hypothetical protein
MAQMKKPRSAGLEHVGDPTETRTWATSPGTYLAGQAAIDEADLAAGEMETKWGTDRLRLLVSLELREKFDRQRYKLNQAIWHGDLEAVRRECARTITAWRTLDQAAMAAGKEILAPEVWEIDVDGYVVAIVRDGLDARAVKPEGRKVVVYTLEEIARLITAMPAIMKAKETWPGATVTASRRTIDDPLLSIHDTRAPLDLEYGDDMPF